MRTAGSFLAVCVMLSAAAGIAGANGPAESQEAPAFTRAEGSREWHFPRDHGQHPRFRLEWWYYTGFLRTAQGREFGFQVTFFRRGLTPQPGREGSAWRVGSLYLAHAALSDLRAGRMIQAARVERDSLGLSGAALDRLGVWLGTWRADPAPGDPHGARLEVDAGAFALRLRLVAEKPPVLHGEGGLDRKGPHPGQASWYYSIPRLRVQGTVTQGGDAWEVQGNAWMDHEFGTSQLGADQTGWDWFSLRLSNGYDLMLYRLRQRQGEAAIHGTLIDPGGRGTPVRISLPAAVEPLRHWTSPQTGARYPVAWRIFLPDHALTLEVTPRFEAQELRPERGLPIAYWEGAVSARGAHAGVPVTGEGYLELTGYAGPLGEAFR